MTNHPLRAVTCVTCPRRFVPRRRDAVYCSPACRQRAHRARGDLADIDRRIDEARREYWALVRLKAEALGAPELQVVTEQAVTVTVDGSVFLRGKHVGTKTPSRAGWAAWGLEAGGPPFDPPPR